MRFSAFGSSLSSCCFGICTKHVDKHFGWNWKQLNTSYFLEFAKLKPAWSKVDSPWNPFWSVCYSNWCPKVDTKDSSLCSNQGIKDQKNDSYLCQAYWIYPCIVELLQSFGRFRKPWIFRLSFTQHHLISSMISLLPHIMLWHQIEWFKVNESWVFPIQVWKIQEKGEGRGIGGKESVGCIPRVWWPSYLLRT